MSINIVIQSKTLDVLESEARFFGVHPTALAKAILDKVATGGLTRDVLQGVDVGSYQGRRRTSPGRKKAMFKGEMRLIGEVAREAGIKLNVINERMKNGWSLDKAATVPVGRPGRPAKKGAK